MDKIKVLRMRISSDSLPEINTTINDYVDYGYEVIFTSTMVLQNGEYIVFVLKKL